MRTLVHAQHTSHTIALRVRILPHIITNRSNVNSFLQCTWQMSLYKCAPLSINWPLVRYIHRIGHTRARFCHECTFVNFDLSMNCAVWHSNHHVPLCKSVVQWKGCCQFKVTETSDFPRQVTCKAQYGFIHAMILWVTPTNNITYKVQILKITIPAPPKMPEAT